ncbi:MAG: hypothetical protein AAGH41_04445 [Pseudomonadota bacterium]
MTTSQQADLQFVREMTEAGRGAPLLGGRIYIFWGILLSTAYVFQWSVLDGRFGLPAQALGLVWIGVGITAGVGMPLLIRGLRNKPGRGAVGNRVDNVVWSLSALSIFSFAVGIAMATAVFGKPAWIWDFVIAVGFVGYGVSLFTTGEMAGLKWMRIPSFIAVIGAGCVPALVGQPEVYLFGATIIIATALVPGIILVAGEPKSLPDES